MKLVQCVPNFSEGRDKAKIDAIVSAIAAVPGVFVMDVEMDANHNRSVVTFFGSPDGVEKAAVAGAREALKHIDMRTHKGEHPRMGATDVVPFTPVLGVTMRDCIAIAEKTGERFAKELGIPVYLYGLAAKKPERANLAHVRKGEYEGLSKEIANPERHPDFGPAQMHPQGGATAVGAREHIINFNVNLKSTDKNLAASIAKSVRASGGGLPELRAKEIDLADKAQVQISTVLTNYSVTGLAHAYEAIESKARAAGVEISDSELIGLVPARSLVDFALTKLKVGGFDPEKQLFENKLLGLLATHSTSLRAGADREEDWVGGARHFCEILAAPLPVPGGGSAAAVMGAMGAALAEKVCAIHHKRLAKARHGESPELARQGGETGTNGQENSVLSRAWTALEPMREKFLDLARRDAQSYAGVSQAYRISKDLGLEREAAIEKALHHASDVPLETMHLGMQALQIFQDYRAHVPAAMASDLQVAIYAMAVAVKGAKENVVINLEGIRDQKFKDTQAAQAVALESRLREFLSSFSFF